MEATNTPIKTIKRFTSHKVHGRTMPVSTGTPNRPLSVPPTSGNNTIARKYPKNEPKIPPPIPIKNNSIKMLAEIVKLEIPSTDSKFTILRFCSNARLIAE